MNRLTGHAGLGVSSIVLILVTLCLTVFSVLALASARVDAHLTERTNAASVRYYAADRAAQKLLAEADVLVKNGGSVTEIAEVSAVEGGYGFAMPVDETRRLDVKFIVESGACRVTEYRLAAVGSAQEDAALHLYAGAEEGE